MRRPAHTPFPLVALVGAVGGMGMLAGCAGTVPVDPASHPVEPPARFSVSGSAPAEARWWTAFGGPGLDAAVDTAFTANFELRTAWERLRAARALADGTGADRLPFVDVSASGRAREGGDRAGESSAWAVDGVASWEVDLLGRIGRRVAADRLRQEATRADYRAAALTVAAEVSRVWMQRTEALAQLRLVETQLATNRTVLTSLENRFRLGLIRAADVLRQRQLIQATLEQEIVVLERFTLLENQLAVLLGRTPASGPGTVEAVLADAPETVDLPAPPPLPDPGVPLDLLQRRPDVRAALLRVRAADADLAAAIRDRFPRLSLSASTATEGASVDDLFQDWISTLAGNLLAPLFYGGQLSAEVDRNRAVREQRLLEYGQTVLVGLREVEDALARQGLQEERIRRIQEQETLARQTFQQLRLQYFNGESNFLDVLTALDEVQGLRRDLLSARLTLLDIRIALYRALAGPVETDREATQ